MNSKINSYDKTAKDEKIEKLKSILDDIENASSLEAIKTILETSNNFIDQLYDRLPKVKDVEELKQIEGFLGAFKYVSEFNQYINNNKDLTKDDKEIFKKEIRKAVGKLEEFYGEYTGIAVDLVAEIMTPYDTTIRSQRRVAFELQYQRENPKNKTTLSAKEYKIKRDEWVNEQLANIEEQIQSDSFDYVRGQLMETTGDIAALTAWVSDPGNIKSNVIQLTKTLLDKADQDVMAEFINIRKKIIDADSEFKKGLPAELITDQKNYIKVYMRKLMEKLQVIT